MGTKMKLMAFALPVLLFMGQVHAQGQSPPPGGRRIDKDRSAEGRAIQALLDGVESERLGDKRFTVACYNPGQNHSMDTITAHILAWFDYSPGDRAIAVSYLLVPWSKESYGDRFPGGYKYPDDAEYRALLSRIASGEKTAYTDRIKRLEMPLPVGLGDDGWFDRMCRVHEYGQYSSLEPTDGEAPKVTLAWLKLDDLGPYYNWGIKSSEIEHIQGRSFRDRTLMLQIQYEILEPVARAILERETPEEWREDYSNYTEAKRAGQ
jgi:hypothetical protein